MSDVIAAGVKSPKKGNKPTEVAFYGGTFSGLVRQSQEQLLDSVRPFLESRAVHGVRISTRPDSLSEEALVFLKKRRVCTIELGVQSMDQGVLEQSGRGYDVETVHRAARLIKTHGFHLGVQLMVGLPGDSRGKAIQTAHRTISLAPDFVRIYPTLVLEGSGLAQAYRRGLYQPLSLDETILICRDMVMLFNQASIEVIRLGLQDTTILNQKGVMLAGPHHPALGQLVRSAVWLKLMRERLKALGSHKESLTIYAAAHDFSNIRGHKNTNVEALRRDFGIQRIELAEDVAIARGDFRLEFSGQAL
jgi:histone acetyltransferase (RNA polymerase elongator complex component)